MEKLISDLLYFSRLGRHELAIKQADIGNIVRDVCTTMDEFLQDANAEVICNELPAAVCDPVRVTELFRNLILNAVKYNKNNKKRIEIGAKSATPSIFYVKDNGIGIDPMFHDDIFRIFKRLNSEEQFGEGTGSGLTFVKKIVERHGGQIWLESEPGHGTTFFFTLEKSI